MQMPTVPMQMLVVPMHLPACPTSHHLRAGVHCSVHKHCCPHTHESPSPRTCCLPVPAVGLGGGVLLPGHVQDLPRQTPIPDASRVLTSTIQPCSLQHNLSLRCHCCPLSPDPHCVPRAVPPAASVAPGGHRKAEFSVTGMVSTRVHCPARWCHSVLTLGSPCHHPGPPDPASSLVASWN